MIRVNVYSLLISSRFRSHIITWYVLYLKLSIRNTLYSTFFLPYTKTPFKLALFVPLTLSEKYFKIVFSRGCCQYSTVYHYTHHQFTPESLIYTSGLPYNLVKCYSWRKTLVWRDLSCCWQWLKQTVIYVYSSKKVVHLHFHLWNRKWTREAVLAMVRH